MKKSVVQKDEKSVHTKRHKGPVYPYIYRSLSFVLISLFVFAPLMMIGLDMAKSTVADAQTYLKIGYNDVSVDDSSNNKTGKDFIDSIRIGSLLGTISCERIGLNEKVYYGDNRVSRRNDVGLNSKSYLFGMGGPSKIAGYNSSSFKTLYNAKQGDIITVESNLGTFKYKVYKTTVAKKAETVIGDNLMLATSKSTDAFSYFADEHFYVYAKLIVEEQ
ncbi:sortase domain-bontaining protein [uncultured Eubacterium sp.]|uniref:sortase domain-containing protein n=1 Tax=uncultured Eubacterium sp. TaxID=165185 RepID=UPI0025E4C472|nr:sortase [uncultured Eubacterium sp.]